MKTRITYRSFLSLLLSVITGIVSGQNINNSDSIVRLKIETYDKLTLPAQVIKKVDSGKKMILFINGSTPYDEKGNLGAFWNDQGKIITEKHEFYLRFLDIMSGKGYPIATIAKRSFVYPTRLPRPGFADLALDIKFLIGELKRTGLIEDENDLVLVGYSEGSIVAAKVMGMLKTQPYACVLLGSATLAFDCDNNTIEDFYMTDILRRQKKWTDEQIQDEFNRLCRIRKDLLGMDEEEFENKYKNSGKGFAAWESLHIIREAALYDPVPDLLYANTPKLICIGSDDMAMPMVSATDTYERLKKRGSNVVLKVIDKDVHQYNKYDVFPIISTWLESNGHTTDFILEKSDSLTIARYEKSRELVKEISSIPFEGSNPEKILACYKKASESRNLDANAWFNLGLRLVGHGFYDQAYNSFSKATDSSFALSFASYVWLGHIKDIQKKRKEATEFYHKAIAAYPGFPIQHGQWDMIIDKPWIEDRLKTPFQGLKK